MSRKPFHTAKGGQFRKDKPQGGNPRDGSGRGDGANNRPGRNQEAPRRDRSSRDHGGDEGRRSQARDPNIVLLWGYHSVREALRSKRRHILKLFATVQAAERLQPELAARGITPAILSPEDLDRRLPPDSVHQGVIAEARPLEPMDISDLPENGLVLVLDQVTDPHNVGAIWRTAAAFAVDAIVTTERHSPSMTGVLAKSASGGLEHVPVVSVVNLARTLEELGRMNYLRVGLDSEGPAPLEKTQLSRPLALVLGAEGKGLRRLSRENCDVLARLDMPGPVKSLNVSNACAVALTMVRLRLASPAE